MKVLVVVDMQKDFITGPLGNDDTRRIVPNVVAELKRAAAKDTLIIFTKDTHEENYMETLEGKNLPVPHCIRDSSGWYICDEVMDAYLETKDLWDGSEVLPFAIDRMIEKPTFGSIDLQNVLCNLDNVEEITLMGVCTGICVLSNAILAKATLPEVPVNVIESCCACVTPETHKTAIEAMKLCQINII